MRTKNGREIVDELCDCGAMKSEHAPRFHEKIKVAVMGHGSCERTKCRQFTWVSWVLAKKTKGGKK